MLAAASAIADRIVARIVVLIKSPLLRAKYKTESLDS
jgi:hypothetical protein